MENVVVVETGKSFEDACRALEQAIADHRFGVLHVHDVQKTLASKGVALGRPVRIFDVCNPQRAKQALDETPLVAAALPCAIAVLVEGDRTRFVFLRPTVMLGLFQAPVLHPMAEEVEGTVRAIVDQAAR